MRLMRSGLERLHFRLALGAPSAERGGEMVIETGGTLLSAMNDANVPVDVWLLADDEHPGQWTLFEMER